MKSRGFTLIEILVSLAIFSVVAVIAIGALVRVTSANRQAQAIQSGVNNVSFIIDTISREMRTGTFYNCSTNPSFSAITFNGCSPALQTNNTGDTVIAFRSSNVDPQSLNCNLIYAYWFHIDQNTKNTTISKAQQSSCNQSIANTDYYPVLSPNVNITDYSVGVFGGVKPKPYAWAFLRLKGYVGQRIQDQSVFNVQTSISERISQ